MCGIVGYVGKREAAPILLRVLHRLEYRGYDSTGIRAQQQAQHSQEQRQGARSRARATRTTQGSTVLHTPGGRRTASRAIAMPTLIATVPDAMRSCTTASSRMHLNCAQCCRLKVVFESETDSEVVAHLIAAMPDEAFQDAVRSALRLITGTYRSRCRRCGTAGMHCRCAPR
jgi:glucosamine--fructose-6-phosphate aminotransferase (isomerizing)